MKLLFFSCLVGFVVFCADLDDITVHINIINDAESQSYTEEQFSLGRLPNLKELADEGVQLMRVDGIKTTTAPGHAMHGTGAPPALSGIVGNSHYDPVQGKIVEAYSCEGVMTVLDIGQSEEERVEMVERGNAMNSCPDNMEQTTLSDEIKRRYEDSVVFVAGIKDRSSIPIGGRRTPHVYWYDDCKMISSNYYMDFYPAWVTDFNYGGFCQGLLNKKWDLQYDQETYLEYNQGREGVNEEKNPVWEEGQPDVFPRKYTDGTPGTLASGPGAIELITEFALLAIDNLEIGHGPRHEGKKTVDQLNLLYSSMDSTLHFTGKSLEYTDLGHVLDLQIPIIVDALKAKGVKSKNILITQTADHGSEDLYQELDDQGYHFATMIDYGSDWMDAMNVEIRTVFGVDFDLIETAAVGNVYFYRTLDLSHEEVESYENYVAQRLREYDPGFRKVWTRTWLQAHNDDQFIMWNFHNERSGNVVFQYDFGRYPYTEDLAPPNRGPQLRGGHSTFSTGNIYIPMFFSGKAIPDGVKIWEPTDGTSYAATTAEILGLRPLSGGFGKVIKEVFED